MNNSEYWEKRLANVVWNSYNTLEEQNMALLEHYNKAVNNIRAELIKLEEQKALTRSDKYRLQHLKSIQEQILKECEKLGDSIENDTIKNVSQQMQDIYKTSFSNINADKFSQLSKNTCKDIINTPWQGSSFSERLWSNTGKLANELNSILSVGITEGKTIAEMAFQLSNRMNKDMNVCHRLVRTETINSLNRASMRGMMDAGVGYVRWWASQDERECDECGANHEKVYPIDKAPNLPCHPGCRCTWLPVFEEELSKAERLSLEQFEEKRYNNSEWKDIVSKSRITSKNEAIRYFIDECGINFKDSRKYPIDSQIITECANWHEKFSKAYKSFIEVNPVKIPAINILPPSKMKNSMGWYSYYSGSPKVVELAMNGKYFTDLSFLDSEALRMFKSGWQSGKNITHTFVHEYGHHVSNSMRWIFENPSWESNFMKECIDDFKKTHDDVKGYWNLGAYVSRYGQSNISETFAEAFAEYFSEEKPREFAMLFGKKLEKVLKGVK